MGSHRTVGLGRGSGGEAMAAVASKSYVPLNTHLAGRAHLPGEARGAGEARAPRGSAVTLGAIVTLWRQPASGPEVPE